MTKRRFIDAPTELRCKATVTLKDGSKAQCGRYKAIGNLCKQHDKVMRRDYADFNCCGGNDDKNQSHTMDCDRFPGVKPRND